MWATFEVFTKQPYHPLAQYGRSDGARLTSVVLSILGVNDFENIFAEKIGEIIGILDSTYYSVGIQIIFAVF
jgi:hypothetical protein